MRVLSAALFLLTPMPAQQPGTLQLPTLLRVGTTPATAPTLTLARDGEPDLRPLPAGTTAFVLRADARTAMPRVQAVLDAAHARGVAQVFLQATLRDGTTGSLLLALPEVLDAPATVTLRAHRDRPGVPPESVIPLLRRLHDGWQQGGKGPFVLGVAMPADATHGQLLSLLAAAVAGGVPSVVVSTHGRPAAAATGGALALDLESSFRIQVQARERVPDRPGAADAPVGIGLRAPASAIAPPGGRAGGLYGGRGGQKRAEDEAMLASLQRGLAWLQAQQRADGSFPDAHGQGDVEATALASLVLLGQGRTLDGGPEGEPLRRSIGWLLARQHDDGRFSDFGPGATRHHALATFALTEAAGLSARGALFRPCAQLALDWLFTQRLRDGGWNDGTPGAPGDATSTAGALASVASAKFFALRCEQPPDVLVAWFDDHPTTDAATGGAELFARYFAGQSPTARMTALADLVAAKADAADPASSYWATYALFQAGGASWQAWMQRLQREVLPRQVPEGGDADAGSWPAAGGATRVTSTARLLWVLTASRRYTRLVR